MIIKSIQLFIMKLLMKKKRSLFLFLLLCVFISVRAQSVADVMLHGGVNFSNLRTTYNEYDQGLGGQGGILAKVGCNWVQCELGLEYSYAAHKYKQDVALGFETEKDDGESYLVQTNVKSFSHNITLPVSLALGYWSDDDGFGFTVSGGGYVAVGLAGKNKVDSQREYYDKAGHLTYVEEEKIYSTSLYGDKNHQLKRFDAGWQVGCMLRLGPVVRVGATYRHGLLNVSNMPTYKMYNKSLMFNVLFDLCPDD